MDLLSRVMLSSADCSQLRLIPVSQNRAILIQSLAEGWWLYYYYYDDDADYLLQ